MSSFGERVLVVSEPLDVKHMAAVFVVFFTFGEFHTHLKIAMSPFFLVISVSNELQ